MPDMIFQFVSENRADQEREYIFKRAEYHAIGVKEYVIVDRFKETALVLLWSPAEYTSGRLHQGRGLQHCELLPGLKVSLKEAFDPGALAEPNLEVMMPRNPFRFYAICKTLSGF